MPNQCAAQPANTPVPYFWRTDGPVNAILVHSNRVYLGGQFSYVGPYTGGAGILSSNTAEARRPFPEVRGSVLSAVSDGEGGWFIGGAFTNVGGLVRSNLAWVRADLAVDPHWSPALNGAVNKLILTNNILYVGGGFTRVGGATRNRLAALAAGSGVLQAWNPNAQSAVSAMVLHNGVMYVGGAFTTVGGQSRSRLAAVDAATGQVSPWNPGASGTGAAVNAMAVANDVIYAGGTFTTAGTKPRNRIVAFKS